MSLRWQRITFCQENWWRLHLSSSIGPWLKLGSCQVENISKFYFKYNYFNYKARRLLREDRRWKNLPNRVRSLPVPAGRNTSTCLPAWKRTGLLPSLPQRKGQDLSPELLFWYSETPVRTLVSQSLCTDTGKLTTTGVYLRLWLFFKKPTTRSWIFNSEWKIYIETSLLGRKPIFY